MTSQRAIERSLSRHDDFEQRADGYRYLPTPFDAIVEIIDGSCRVTVSIPTLDTVVQNESVPTVVASGWRETLERRLTGAFDAVGLDISAPEDAMTITQTDEQLQVQYAFVPPRSDQAAQDLAGIINYVEGTYVQGVIPGYEYDDPVAGLLARAGDQGGSEDLDANRGGTPL